MHHSCSMNPGDVTIWGPTGRNGGICACLPLQCPEPHAIWKLACLPVPACRVNKHCPLLGLLSALETPGTEESSSWPSGRLDYDFIAMEPALIIQSSRAPTRSRRGSMCHDYRKTWRKPSTVTTQGARQLRVLYGCGRRPQPYRGPQASELCTDCPLQAKHQSGPCTVRRRPQPAGRTVTLPGRRRSQRKMQHVFA